MAAGFRHQNALDRLRRPAGRRFAGKGPHDGHVARSKLDHRVKSTADQVPSPSLSAVPAHQLPHVGW
jgi:hypothetical protein